MASHKADEIVRIVNKMEGERGELHKLMDGDVDLYNQETYLGELDGRGVDVLAGSKHFTGNDPTTTMDLAQHLGSTARRIIRVHQSRAQEEQKEIDNMKELFSLGMLVSIDERRANLDMPNLQDAMFAQSLFRGRIAQRVLFIKEDVEATDTEPAHSRTYVDVTDWDPRDTYYGIGKHGLSWACEKSKKSRRSLIDEYGIDPTGAEVGQTLSDDDYDEDYAVYDWMEEDTNTVVVQNNGSVNPVDGLLLEAFKPATPHGMVRTAAVIVRSTLKPKFQSSNGTVEGANDNGAFYKSSRKLFNELNFLLSVVSELAKRSITPGLKILSKGGSLTIDEDPSISGQQTSLDTEQDQDIQRMENVEMAKEASALMGIISGMIQRGTFPASAFGELAFQLSGFAITQLRQGLQAPLTPHIKAVERALKQILDLLADSYATGRFDLLTLSGRIQNSERTYFSQEITPEMVKAGGNIEVELTAQLPQDDAAKMSLIQMMREGPGGIPLISDRGARVMAEIQDPMQMDREVWEEMASRGSEVALAYNSMKAAYEQGNEALAEFWADDLNIARMKKFLELLQLAMLGAPVPGGQNGVQNGGGNGQVPASRTTPNSQTQPPEVRGTRSAPGQQAGPVVPPGTPRPGAQNFNDPSIS